MSRSKYDFRFTALGDEDVTPADSFERQSMIAIERRTQRIVIASLIFGICALLVSGGALVVSSKTLSYLIHEHPQQAETLDGVRSLLGRK